QIREQAAVLALAARCRQTWHLLSHALEDAGTALSLAAGMRTGFEQPEFVDVLEPQVVQEEELTELEAMIVTLAEQGVSLVTVLDNAYPSNLRLVYDRAPFLFVRGRLPPEGDRAIAVVGTRNASVDGLEQAARLAHGLAARGVTVLSGLARGIDAAAHVATLDAGGRTVAVVGHGIRARTYPPEHAPLAERIVSEGGAVISQFLPDAPPRQDNFRLRNRTMSGLALGTVVVEASDNSGARMQARIALQHGKRVFLHRRLVLHEAWARRSAEHPGATVVEDAAEVLDVLDGLPRASAELTLS
ncbi:MAG: DNA-processing protein DprA, partial [Actinomycetota bacterium]